MCVTWFIYVCDMTHLWLPSHTERFNSAWAVKIYIYINIYICTHVFIQRYMYTNMFTYTYMYTCSILHYWCTHAHLIIWLLTKILSVQFCTFSTAQIVSTVRSLLYQKQSTRKARFGKEKRLTIPFNLHVRILSSYGITLHTVGQGDPS